MARRSRSIFLVATTLAILLIPLAECSFAQDWNQDWGSHFAKSRPGGYLSVIKLFLIAAVFLGWVRFADWINRDAMKIGERTGLTPEFWNPVVVFSFLIGFFAAISVPIFYAGFAIYVIAAVFPGTFYYIARRGKLIESPGIAQYIKLQPGEVPKAEALPQDAGADVEFKPAGADAAAKQENLIKARQTGGFADLKDMLDICQFKRADQWLLDFTQTSTASRIFVDGFWHPLEPIDRERADAMLASMKFLAGRNPLERRAAQTGKFSIKSDHGKSDLAFHSQGVPTGERVQIKFTRAAKVPVDFSQLGMFPEMFDKVKTSLDHKGLTIISAPPTAGLTTSWQGALVTTDRLTRDCVGLIGPDETETVLENIVIHRYDESGGKQQFDVLNGLLLTQPDMLVVPLVENPKTMDHLILQVTQDDRALVLQVSAKSAAEALLRLYAQAGDRGQFLDALQTVTCQRLVRRLCDSCKVEIRVQPNVIKQLGGDPNTQGTIFIPWRLPPPEQQVDEKGKPIEFPPCEACGGIGYFERIAVFEIISVTDPLRDFIKKNPNIPAIEKAATKLGKKPMIRQAYQLVLSGVTSLDEVQRVFK